MVIDNPQASLSFVGQVNLKLYNQYNDLITERNATNFLTTAGLSTIVNRIAGASLNTASPYYMSIGTGSTTTPLMSMGSLVTPVGTMVALNKQLLQSGSVIDFAAAQQANQLRFSASFAAGNGTATIIEAGIFDNSSSVLLQRVEYDPITKGANDVLVIQWTLTIN